MLNHREIFADLKALTPRQKRHVHMETTLSHGNPPLQTPKLDRYRLRFNRDYMEFIYKRAEKPQNTAQELENWND